MSRPFLLANGQLAMCWPRPKLGAHGVHARIDAGADTEKRSCCVHSLYPAIVVPAAPHVVYFPVALASRICMSLPGCDRREKIQKVHYTHARHGYIILVHEHANLTAGSHLDPLMRDRPVGAGRGSTSVFNARVYRVVKPDGT